jgi:hypothetical protein
MTVPSSAMRESITLLSVYLQKGQCTTIDLLGDWL